MCLRDSGHVENGREASVRRGRARSSVQCEERIDRRRVYNRELWAISSRREKRRDLTSIETPHAKEERRELEDDLEDNESLGGRERIGNLEREDEVCETYLKPGEYRIRCVLKQGVIPCGKDTAGKEWWEKILRSTEAKGTVQGRSKRVRRNRFGEEDSLSICHRTALSADRCKVWRSCTYRLRAWQECEQRGTL